MSTMRTLQCQFEGTARHYNYLYTGSKDVQPGDWAVVHSNSKFNVVSIKGVRLGVDKAVTKPVLAVLTTAEFDQYKESIKRIQDYRSAFDELDHIIAEEKRLDKYRELAKNTTNPRVMELVGKIGAFSGTQLLPDERPFNMQVPDEEVVPPPPFEMPKEAADAPSSDPEPIPAGWYWNAGTKTFHNKDFHVCSYEFLTKWKPRASEFPTDWHIIHTTEPDPSGLKDE